MNTSISDIMKKVSYVLLVLVFFNLSINLLYYLQVVNYNAIKIFDNYFDVLFTNILLIILIVIYMFIYLRFMIERFNYFKSVILGVIIGIVICVLYRGLAFEEYLFIVLSSALITTFISYSLYFERIKDEVFK